MAIRFSNGFSVGTSGATQNLTFFTNLNTIATYLSGYMSDFRNPDFYSYTLDGDGFYINDGGNDMYDSGNATSPWLISNTDYTSYLSYSTTRFPHAVDYQITNRVDVRDNTFGYVSLGYSSPSLLPLTVIGTRATSANSGDPIGFQCGGNLGADGQGDLATGNIYSGDNVSGYTVHAYYRQTYNAGDPSVCDVYILIGHSNWNSVFGNIYYGADPVVNGGCGGYLYTSGNGAQNILAIKTLLSKDSGVEVTFNEVQTVVDNFILRVNESQGSQPSPSPTPTPTPVCNSNYIISGGGTTHVYNPEVGTYWNGYGNNYLQVGPSQDGGGTVAPQAGWYFVDDCGTVRQLLNTPLWFSNGNPSPYPNGTGWLCDVDGPFVLANSVLALTFYETIPSVIYPTPTPTPTPTQTLTPTPSATPLGQITQRVLFLGDSQVSTNASDLSNTLLSLGYNLTIDTQQLGTNYDGSNIASGNYNLIIMQTNGNHNGAAALSGNLKTFMDNGGHFIGQTFLWSIAPSGFDYTYTPFSSGNQTFNGGNLTLANSHPVLGGFTYSSVGSSFVNAVSSTLQSNSTLVYKFADNTPLLAVQEVGQSRRVGINFYESLTSNTFVGRTMATSILWCLGYYDAPPTPTPTPTATSDVTPTPTPSSTSAVTPTPTPSATVNLGVGSWYFYSDEGPTNAVPPTNNGNAVFLSPFGVSETFNPNKASGADKIFFNTRDSSGTNYTSQFSGYTGGTGTITISQNGDTATYTSTTNGSFTIQSFGPGNPVFQIDTALCTQTKSSNASFVYADPISITFS